MTVWLRNNFFASKLLVLSSFVGEYVSLQDHKSWKVYHGILIRLFWLLKDELKLLPLRK